MKLPTIAAVLLGALTASPAAAAPIFTQDGVADDGTITAEYRFEEPGVPDFGRRVRFSLQFDDAVQLSPIFASTTYYWFYTDFDEYNEVDIPGVYSLLPADYGPLTDLTFRLPLNPSVADANAWYSDLVLNGETATSYSLFLNANVVSDGPVGYRLSIAYVPEPSVWALLILGFGAVGFAMRQRPARLTCHRNTARLC
ncbi:PEP-CTERM sorting domain-containing protein [Erythrobacter litoralis]|uniref:PEPxxWA-CTERM sorting domain-containing protein n=1 Tax=Erythrobacter litoralis TaxID=39960 RepID=UPI0024348361|nr:PEPxxWA-CTERM sorting domain-containing protein [Erythrobacter litoralis]MDG6077809.1 PEP-CTERM sorting domain-containing protein [Erythrobacter litoralis]